jgi:hypothetical protein
VEIGSIFAITITKQIANNMNNIIKETQICGHKITATQKDDGIYFYSPYTGGQFLNEKGWTERCEAHWKGFVSNQFKHIETTLTK